MHKYIVEGEDIQRLGRGVYSPGLRDDAQDARDSLLERLRDTPGQEAFFALQHIAVEHPAERGRAVAARLARARAVADADRPGWLVSQVREFQAGLERSPRNHQELHDLAVERLIDLKHMLEHGETSLANLLLSQEETVVRNFVADWLAAKSVNRYIIAQEEERADKKRTDFRFAHIAFNNPVPVELKLAHKWPGTVLVERLENQLCNDYLRDKRSSRGVFLLVHQGGRQHWILPDGTKVASIEALTDALKAHWSTVAKNFPHVHAVQIIGIDLTLRAKPMRNSANKKLAKKSEKAGIEEAPTKAPGKKSKMPLRKSAKATATIAPTKRPKKAIGKLTKNGTRADAKNVAMNASRKTIKGPAKKTASTTASNSPRQTPRKISDRSTRDAAQPTANRSPPKEASRKSTRKGAMETAKKLVLKDAAKKAAKKNAVKSHPPN